MSLPLFFVEAISRCLHQMLSKIRTPQKPLLKWQIIFRRICWCCWRCWCCGRSTVYFPLETVARGEPATLLPLAGRYGEIKFAKSANWKFIELLGAICVLEAHICGILTVSKLNNKLRNSPRASLSYPRLKREFLNNFTCNLHNIKMICVIPLPQYNSPQRKPCSDTESKSLGDTYEGPRLPLHHYPIDPIYQRI